MNFSYKKINSELPNGWTFIRISEIARVNSETVNKSYKNDFIHYIDISSVSTGVFESPKLLSLKDAPSRAKRILKEGDIIISTVRPNLRQYSLLEGVGSNWVASTGFAVVRANKEKFKWYLYSFLTSSVFNDYLVRVADGAAYPTFNPKEIEEAEIPLPDEQSLEVISNLARVINQKIKTNNNMNQILEKLAQTIFRSWFIDFDPVYAKKLALEKGLTSTQAERAAMAIISGVCSPTDFAENYEEMDKKLSAKLSKMSKEKQEDLADTVSLFPCEFEESELGEIPTGWKAGIVKDISMVKAGYAFKSKDFQDTGLPVVKIKNIDDLGRVSLNDVQYITESMAEKATRFKLKTGDFLIAMTGAKVGKCGLLTTQGKPAYLNQRVGKFEPYSPKHIGYIYTLFMREESQNYVLTAAQGSAQPNISSDGIERMKTVIPPNDLIDLFSSFSSHVINKITTSELEILRLSELRDTLLPKLLAGEIDLSKIEIMEDS